jgi:AraC-like DNA-binding protein/quercetin dioxygenase-like cupin family protein
MTGFLSDSFRAERGQKKRRRANRGRYMGQDGSRNYGHRLKHFEAQESRLQVDFVTDRGQYHAAHWNSSLEIIYLLNGNARILLDGQQVSLVQGEFIVIDSGRVFELQCKESFMQIRIRADKEFLSARAGDLSQREGIVNRRYFCLRESLKEEQLDGFLEICELFKRLVPLYINEPTGFRLKTESIVLDILYHLVQDFSEEVKGGQIPEVTQDLERVRQILAYIEENYEKPLSLQTVSSTFGLSREYFSRLFHQSIGMTFLEHLTGVRIAHFYHDLITTDEPIMKLLEDNGLTNYKHFRKHFKELYGCSPREVRKIIL